MDVGMTLQPAVLLRLVSIQVIDYHMDFAARVRRDDLVHKIRKFPASAALVMRGFDHTGGHLEGGEQGGCSVTFIAVTKSVYRLAIRQPQLSLGAFQRLN